MVAGDAMRCALSYLMTTQRVRVDLNWSHLRQLWQFGQWVLLSSILAFLFTQGDDIVGGKWLGAGALGLYQMAYKISNVPTTEVTHALSTVLFPAYATLQDDLPRLRAAYTRVVLGTATVAGVFTLVLILGGPFLTQVLLGEHWMGMVPALQILAIWGFIRRWRQPQGRCFMAWDVRRVITRVQIVQTLTLALLVYPFSTSGALPGIRRGGVGGPDPQ